MNWRREAVSAAGMMVTLGLILAGYAFGAPEARKVPGAGTDSGRVPVLVELFTSEGCSSCPPADTLLARLQATQPLPGVQIIALGEHVDYWNQLGWKDPYSSAAFSARQNEYAAASRSSEVYTPEMVVNGREGFVGSNENVARAAIAREASRPHAKVVIAPAAGGRYLIRVSDLPSGSGPADVYAAVTEGGLASSVTHGENAGRRLTHAAVTRRVERIGVVTPGATFTQLFPVPASKGGDVRFVAFVQEHGTRHILGAAERQVEE